jgi:hypothetical protein
MCLVCGFLTLLSLYFTRGVDEAPTVRGWKAPQKIRRTAMPR